MLKCMEENKVAGGRMKFLSLPCRKEKSSQLFALFSAKLQWYTMNFRGNSAVFKYKNNKPPKH